MKNNTTSRIIIEMNHIDNANRFKNRLSSFCKTAAQGGDCQLFVKHNGELKDCGFVAHDLSIKKISHEIDGSQTNNKKLTTTAIWLFMAFAIGMAVHFGSNTAKIIWPMPPVEFKVSVSE